MSEVAPQHSRATGTQPVPAKVKSSQGPQGGKVRRDCCGAIAPYTVAFEIKVLQRGEVGQMWPHCCDTSRTYFIVLKA